MVWSPMMSILLPSGENVSTRGLNVIDSISGAKMTNRRSNVRKEGNEAGFHPTVGHFLT